MLPLNVKQAVEFDKKRVRYAVDEINDILKSKSVTIGGTDLVEKCIMLTLRQYPMSLWERIINRVLTDPQWEKYTAGLISQQKQCS